MIGYPYVFRSYDHAEAVWRGPVGKKILQTITTNSRNQIEALAFSYSGGFRALVGSKPVHSAADVCGAKVLTEQGLSPDTEFLTALGGIPAVENSESAPALSGDFAQATRHLSQLLADRRIELFSVEINGLAYAEQSAPIDHAPLYLSVTDHTMYVTSIVANRSFLDSLEPALRKLLLEETRWFAVAERQLSARLAVRNLEAFSKVFGRAVVELDEAARETFRDAAHAVFTRYPTWLSEAIKDIEDAGSIPLMSAPAAELSPPA